MSTYQLSQNAIKIQNLNINNACKVHGKAHHQGCDHVEESPGTVHQQD